MIYRIGIKHKAPFIAPGQDLTIGTDNEYPFFLLDEVKSFGDVWKIQHIQFLDYSCKDTDEYPDITVQTGKLFLSEKAYDILHDVLTGHGEFLPVTFNAGKGYIFNPLKIVEHIPESVEMGDEHNPDFLMSFKLKEDNLPPVFKDDLAQRDVFINKDLYRMIKLNGLKGLRFFKDYGFAFAEPEEGLTDEETTMPSIK